MSRCCRNISCSKLCPAVRDHIRQEVSWSVLHEPHEGAELSRYTPKSAVLIVGVLCEGCTVAVRRHCVSWGILGSFRLRD